MPEDKEYQDRMPNDYNLLNIPPNALHKLSKIPV
jgi:hypothetical protein